MNDVFAFFGKVVLAGGGASAIAFFMFKHLAAKWLDDRFKKNFQQLVHDQNKEIERLRSDLTKSFDRVSKLHSREFETLPQLWEKVSDCFWATIALISPLQERAELNHMKPKQLTSFLDQSGLTGWWQDEVIAATDKTSKFYELYYFHRLSNCQSALRLASVALSRTGIFIDPGVNSKLREILDLVVGAQVEYELNNDHPKVKFTDRQHAYIDRLGNEGKELMGEAERMIRDSIWQQ